MSRAKDAFLAALVLLLARRRRRAEKRRIVPKGPKAVGAENLVILLLLAGAGCAVAFVVFYALDRLPHQTQLLGAALGCALLLLAAAAVVFGKRLVVEEEIEDVYAEEHLREQEEIVQIVDESRSRLTRKRLLLGAAGAAGGALGLAAITPAVSLGPVFDVEPLAETPWSRGRRLVDESGRPYRADDIERSTFYTAYPEGADHESIGAPLVVVRLEPAELALPAGRHGWAPGGILAYSKICTHAGCAIALYRAPLFRPTEPRPAFVCPCHYSTFDPATGGTVLFGPAGRALPQLPLRVDASGHLRAGGNFSGPVGPSWWGVRIEKPRP